MACLVSMFLIGCTPEPKAEPQITVEQEEKLDKEHAAAVEAIKTGNPPNAAVPAAGGAPAAPAAAGHAK